MRRNSVQLGKLKKIKKEGEEEDDDEEEEEDRCGRLMEDRPAAVHRMASFTRRLFDATIDAGGGPTAKRQKKNEGKTKKKETN